MASTTISVSSSPLPRSFLPKASLHPKHGSISTLPQHTSLQRTLKTHVFTHKGKNRSLRMAITDKNTKHKVKQRFPDKNQDDDDDHGITVSRMEEKLKRRKSERNTYLVAAIMSSLGITSMTIASVYYRFSWQMEGGEIPLLETLCTFALLFGAAVGMEYWARWAHRELWHASLWRMHESHHRPREGPFELNDVFAIFNSVPAIALISYGLFNRGIIPSLCYGAGLGITMFGIAYMFVHDGLVHHRFPVGPIANVPYLRRVAAAHQVHHSNKFDGVPYGLFLGPKELEQVGGSNELDKEIKRRMKTSTTSTTT